VAVLDVGAYGFSESMPFFLSHPTPAEVAIRDGEPFLIRPRIAPTVWLDWQLLADPAVSVSRDPDRGVAIRGMERRG